MRTGCFARYIPCDRSEDGPRRQRDISRTLSYIRAPLSTEAGYTLERELPQRVVILGDLNAQNALMRRYLVDLKLIHKKSGAWIGGKTVFVQMGDIPNRGPSARAAMDLMMDIRPQAQAAGGDVYWLLGNHEVMSVLGHEAYVTAEEYMEFARPEEIDSFYTDRTRYIYEQLGAPDVAGIVEPLGGKMRAWEEAHAPGKEVYRKMMGANGKYGRQIRKLPIAFRFGQLLFVHGGLSPTWAAQGIDGLARLARDEWAKKPRFYQELDPQSIFRDPVGPLWHRAYCVAKAKVVKTDLLAALDLVGAKMMFVGHTRTDSVDPLSVSMPLLRQRGRVVMTDVGIGDPGEPGSVLVIEKNRIETWTTGGTKSRLADI
jgi:hypothetical protein